MKDDQREKKTVVTDGQDLEQKAAELKKSGVTDVTVVINTINYTRYKESNDGKQLQPVIDGINKAVRRGPAHQTRCGTERRDSTMMRCWIFFSLH